MNALIPTILLVIYALTSTAGLVLVKLGSKTDAPISFIGGRLHLNFSAYVLLGIFLYGLSFLLYTYLVAKNDLGYIIPVSTALVYIGIFIASFLIFKEVFTVIKITGILLILLGVILLNIHSK